jgi:hypothetical protein
MPDMMPTTAKANAKAMFPRWLRSILYIPTSFAVVVFSCYFIVNVILLE